MYELKLWNTVEYRKPDIRKPNSARIWTGQIRIFKKTTYSQRPESDTAQILDNQI